MTATIETPQAAQKPKKHCAPFSPEILDVMTAWLYAEAFWQGKTRRMARMRLLDPFAGVGRVHVLPCITVGVELEHEWACQHPDTIVGSALHLPWPDAGTGTGTKGFDIIATSPCYGNRFSDHHVAKDGSTRRSYTHDLGHLPSEESSATLPWGPAYRAFHELAWAEADRVLRPGGLVMLNISDHVKTERKGEPPVVQKVSRWHLEHFLSMGYRYFARRDVPTKRMRYGANYDNRVGAEHVFAFRKPE